MFILKKIPQKQSMINQLIKDEALISGKTEKEQRDELLFERYLRDIRNKSIIEDMYNQGIGKGLSTFWLDAAYREDDTNKAGVLKYMIKLAEAEGSIDTPDRKNPEFPHFLGQLKLVYYKLQYEAYNNGNGQMKMEAETLEKLFKLYRCGDEQEGKYLRLIYHIIENNWAVLRDNQRAMFALMDVALVQKKWVDSPETRMGLVSVINNSI